MALIETSMYWLAWLMAGPVSIILVMALLYQIVGIAALYGLVVCLLLFALQFPINALALRLRLRIAEATDKRINIIKNLIQGIQTIKSYAWKTLSCKEPRPPGRRKSIDSECISS